MKFKNWFKKTNRESNLPRLHFMHIPKTGGSSLNSFLEHQFAFKSICPAHYLHSKPLLDWVKPEHVFENLNLEVIKQYKFFRGHLGWLPQTYFPASKIETITFLRHPIEHLLSIYNHISGSEEDFKLSFNKWKNFEEFIFDPTIEIYLSNIQTQHFCTDHYVKKNTALTESLADIVGTWVFDINLSQNSRLALALERLEKCEFIGIQENYNASFKALCQQYNWIIPSKVPSLNVRKNRLTRNDLCPRMLKRIEQLTQLDMAVYNQALKIVKMRQIKSLFRFKWAPLADLNSEIHFTFKDKIIGEGWHHRETSGDDFFCWSNIKKPTLIFYVKPNISYKITLHVLHSTLNTLNDLTLFIDKNFIELKFQPGNILTGSIPANIIPPNGKLILMFDAPTTRILGDERDLGFACKLIEIKPELSKSQRAST